MSGIFVSGIGVVSPAGWGAQPFFDALSAGLPLPVTQLERPRSNKTLRVRAVPRPALRPAILNHPRLRRSSLITQYTVASAFEALGGETERIRVGEVRLGIVVCLMPGCVTYSRRLYEEVLGDPGAASPLLFPETVFNAPASHLAACLNSGGASCALVGDETTFLQGVALAASWLVNGEFDGCLVIGAEEMDWIVAEAVHLFHHNAIHSEGAGALYLTRTPANASSPRLSCVTDPFQCGCGCDRAEAARRVRAEFNQPAGPEVLCDASCGLARPEKPERDAWSDWKGRRLSPGRVLGGAFTASAAWQCCAASHLIASGEFDAANVSVVSANGQAIGARFIRPPAREHPLHPRS